MIQFKIHSFFLICTLFINQTIPPQPNCLLPIASTNRFDPDTIKLTAIGAFGLTRKARPTVPEHLHTGIDIKRPNDNYANEPVFPIMSGRVISLRDDGPFAQIIIEHELSDESKIWTVYEHIAGILVSLAELVEPSKPIARFMNKQELNRYGWQFDHFHFEILKIRPRPLKPIERTPFRLFGPYNLECYTMHDLNKYYFDPLEFLKLQIE